MRDDGSWFTDTIRITDTKPGHGAMFGYHKSRSRPKLHLNKKYRMLEL